MVENLPDESGADEQAAAELEKELLDAMSNLRRKNKNIEEYLDGLARDTEKTAEAEKPAEEENETPPD
jgi:predicted  nucleic acid-binding Zn-ribbon protein